MLLHPEWVQMRVSNLPFLTKIWKHPQHGMWYSKKFLAAQVSRYPVNCPIATQVSRYPVN